MTDIVNNTGKEPLLGIMILNHNGLKWLAPLYQSIQKQTYRNFKIYLVDNASDDKSVETTLKEHPYVTVLRLPENLGFSMAYNIAMPHVFRDGCDWVILANNDILLKKNCLEEMAKAALGDSRNGVLGPVFLEWEGDSPNYYIKSKHPQAIEAMRQNPEKTIEVDWVEGSFFMIKRECAETVGPLDPFLFFYWEDADFCRRARYQSWKVSLVPKALLRHYAKGWSREGKNRKKANFLLERNQYIYVLTDPKFHFINNIGKALYLLCVNIKASFFGKRHSIAFEIHVVFAVIIKLALIHKKWQSDRMRKKPIEVTRKYRCVKAERFEG